MSATVLLTGPSLPGARVIGRDAVPRAGLLKFEDNHAGVMEIKYMDTLMSNPDL